MNVAHVITGLETGGAEVMLYRLLAATDRDRFRSSVVSLTGLGPVGDDVRRLGVPVRALAMRPGIPDPVAIARLARWLRRDRPDVVQTWMYHADLLGGVAAKAAGNVPVAWGLHNTDLAPGVAKRSTVATALACARLSPWLPAAIVCCTEATRRVHERLGYRADKMVVVPNGFDLDDFKPDAAARAAVRRELGLPPDAPLIGLLARFHPQKGHRFFLEAAALLAARRADVHFLLCGDGVTRDNAELAARVDAAGLSDRCHLLGRRRDTARLQASLDVATSASVAGEALSLALGEAMACAVPCAVTDVGDSALLVGDTGRVVPPGDAAALAAAWQGLLALSPVDRAGLGQRARERIAEHFALPRTVRRYECLYARLAGEHRCAG